MVEPWMRTIILILKIWTKKSNNPYIDTISLYGYVLLVIYYFVNGLKDGVSPFSASTLWYTHDVVSIRSIGGLLSEEHKGLIQYIVEEGGAVNGGHTCTPGSKKDEDLGSHSNLKLALIRVGFFDLWS
ncbi:uncharacterized protein MELLADRAFT_101600 [Melampsora larici-populina 98AG31]|uniref:Uncharacterized protein n=1 Tax=Melampsora larici-populina (strain 98AG31 / pathotype 3-4-7) TaxID=747676 RepID=F4R6D3_MELLP|nr:uncharacterized protein MELLADRAFT_101600 [Melampsora larici-populina 98AG31]EGG11858.1 hypothetical protein MELLADRAFT_101600 [Melampsora larici-populina 98AG31]